MPVRIELSENVQTVFWLFIDSDRKVKRRLFRKSLASYPSTSAWLLPLIDNLIQLLVFPDYMHHALNERMTMCFPFTGTYCNFETFGQWKMFKVAGSSTYILVNGQSSQLSIEKRLSISDSERLDAVIFHC